MVNIASQEKIVRVENPLPVIIEGGVLNNQSEYFAIAWITAWEKNRLFCFGCGEYDLVMVDNCFCYRSMLSDIQNKYIPSYNIVVTKQLCTHNYVLAEYFFYQIILYGI